MYHRKKYEWKPVQIKKILTYIKNVDINTLLQIKDDDVFMNMCLLNKYTLSLMDNYFWELKIKQYLPEFKLPKEYSKRGIEIFLIIKNISIFEKKETDNFGSRYYGQHLYHYNNYDNYYSDYTSGKYDLEISVANWCVKNNNPILLKTLLELNIYPDNNYINDEYNNDDIIKILVNYINNNPNIDINNIHQLLPEASSILALPATGSPDLIELLLPFNIVNVQDLIEMILVIGDVESLKMLMKNNISLTQEHINMGFFEEQHNEHDYPVTKMLIENSYYPDEITFDSLYYKQKQLIENLREQI